jgi:hypothetical protein
MAPVLMQNGKYKKLLPTVTASSAVPIFRFLLVEAYGANAWLTKRYLIMIAKDKVLRLITRSEINISNALSLADI